MTADLYGLYCHDTNKTLEPTFFFISTEGSLGQQDVTCNFDKLYSCGYTWENSAGNYWKRVGAPSSKYSMDFIAILTAGRLQ